MRQVSQVTGGREGPGEHAPKRRERHQALHAMSADRKLDG